MCGDGWGGGGGGGGKGGRAGGHGLQKIFGFRGDKYITKNGERKSCPSCTQR